MGSLRGCCFLVAVATNESSLLRIDGASNAPGRFVDLAHDFLQRKSTAVKRQTANGREA
jgi:hypothetical protein